MLYLFAAALAQACSCLRFIHTFISPVDMSGCHVFLVDCGEELNYHSMLGLLVVCIHCCFSLMHCFCVLPFSVELARSSRPFCASLLVSQICYDPL